MQMLRSSTFPPAGEPMHQVAPTARRTCSIACVGGLTLALAQSCLISPKDYPVDGASSDLEGEGGSESPLGGKTSTAGKAGSGSKAGGSGGTFAGASPTFGGTFSSLAGSSGMSGTGGASAATCSSAADCDDANDCTKDTCVAKTCQHAAIVLPAKATWLTTASVFDKPGVICTNQEPYNATDGDPTTRWTSGKAQSGDEWLQVDFGSIVVFNRVTLDSFVEAAECGAPGDYPRHFQIRVSNSTQNFGAPVLLEGNGTVDATMIDFPKPATGRYLLISQTGIADPSWWSVFELDASCH